MTVAACDGSGPITPTMQGRAMSRHEKHATFGPRQDPQDPSRPTDELGLDDLDGTEDLLKTGFVGKEVKIGLAVVLVLVIALGAVAVKRWRQGGDSPSKAGAEQQASKETKPAPGKPEGPAHSAPAKSNKATAASTPKDPWLESRAQAPSNDGDKWPFASDAATTAKASERRPASPPSFSSKGPSSTPPDRFSGFTASKGPSLSTGGWESDSGGAGTKGGPRQADPFQTRAPFSPALRETTGKAAATPSASATLAADRSGTAPRSSDTLVPSFGSRAPEAPGVGNPLRGPSPTSGAAGSASASSQPSGPAGSSTWSRDSEAPLWNATPAATSPDRFGDRTLTSPAPRALGSSAPASAAGGIGGARTGTQADQRRQGTYEVQFRDTFWTISQKLYGTGAYSQALSQHNRSRVPREADLRAGDVILAPATAELEKLYPELCPSSASRETAENRSQAVPAPGRSGPRVYVVQPGDTLYDIARRELGKAVRWTELYELNREAIGGRLEDLAPGTQLRLPADAPEAITTHNGSGSRR